MSYLKKVPTEALLEELKSREGHPAKLAEAALLAMKKAKDYSHGKNLNPHKTDRSEYFPFGPLSYAQMIHVKSQRFVSLVRKQQSGESNIFEGLYDTALDLINYAGFYLDSEKKEDLS